MKVHPILIVGMGSGCERLSASIKILAAVAESSAECFQKMEEASIQAIPFVITKFDDHNPPLPQASGSHFIPGNDPQPWKRKRK